MINLTVYKGHLCLLSVCFSLSVFTVSCSSPKDVSKENFGKVIEKSIKEYPGRLKNYGFGGSSSCFVQINDKDQIPLQRMSQPVKYRGSNGSMMNTTMEQLDVLSQYGFLTSKTIKEEETVRDGKMVTKEYELTDQGKSKLVLSKNKRSQFISYCKISFKSVTSYTEPSDAGMGKYTNVMFTYAVEDVDAWAKDPAHHEIFPRAKAVVEALGKPIEYNMALVLTSEGWTNPDDSGHDF